MQKNGNRMVVVYLRRSSRSVLPFPCALSCLPSSLALLLLLLLLFDLLVRSGFVAEGADLFERNI